MIRKVTIWIYLVYQWGLVMISQKLWNTVWIRLGGMNVQPALGFTRVPDDLSPFSPLALATPAYQTPDELIKNNYIIKWLENTGWFSKNHLTPDELINRSCPFLRAGAVCSMEADPSMNQPTTQTTTPVTISLCLTDFDGWIAISMCIVGSWWVLSHIISMFPCLTALLLKSQWLCTLNLPMFGGSSDWIKWILKNNSISVAELVPPQSLPKGPLDAATPVRLGNPAADDSCTRRRILRSFPHKIGTTDHKTTRKLLEPSKTRESRRQKNTCWIWP